VVISLASLLQLHAASWSTRTVSPLSDLVLALTIQLSEAEAAFRIHKSELCIRPIGHHKQERIKAHILICFLAYALWKTLQKWQSRAGLGDSPRTILTELSRIHSADIVLPLADGSNRELRLRCVVRPDREQQLLLQRLGLTLPQRLRPTAVAQM